jgi:hypothetical protein
MLIRLCHMNDNSNCSSVPSMYTSQYYTRSSVTYCMYTYSYCMYVCMYTLYVYTYIHTYSRIRCCMYRASMCHNMYALYIQQRSVHARMYPLYHVHMYACTLYNMCVCVRSITCVCVCRAYTHTNAYMYAL